VWVDGDDRPRSRESAASFMSSLSFRRSSFGRHSHSSDQFLYLVSNESESDDRFNLKLTYHPYSSTTIVLLLTCPTVATVGLND